MRRGLPSPEQLAHQQREAERARQLRGAAGVSVARSARSQRDSRARLLGESFGFQAGNEALKRGSCDPSLLRECERRARPIGKGSEEGLPKRIAASTNRPTIRPLLDLCRPPTVARLVVAVVVDAVDRCSRGALAHVGEEVLEALAPPLAHLDPAATVVPPSSMRAVSMAPREHRHPAPIRRRRFALGGVPMPRPPLTRLRRALPSQTAATLRVAATKTASANDSLSATVAATSPSRLAIHHAPSAFDNSQPAEALPGEIDQPRARHAFQPQAATREDATAREVTTAHGRSVAAVAFADPLRLAGSLVLAALNDDEATDPLAAEIAECHC